jgi:hypothetical protein
MANKFTRFLGSITGATGLAGGLLNPKGIASDYRHGRRLFIDDTFRLSPRQKFLFYVNFEIDKSVVRSTKFVDKHIQEIGYLIKTADLPKFTFDSTVKNQYNRKKILYKQINYDALNLVFHDDSAGIINAMWSLYYGYYIHDRHNPLTAYGANHLRASRTNIDNFRYGMDNQITTPFFKTINLYTMSRRRFLGYTLVNPRIKSWSHGGGDYSVSEPNENSMAVEYEAVLYSGGNVSYNNPKGFAVLHYDNTPSPLSVAGGGVSRILGEGGVLDGLEQIFGDVNSGEAFGSARGFLGTAIKTINTYKNIKNLPKDALKREAINILSSPAGASAVAGAIGGIAGAVFPKRNPDNETTNARTKNLTITQPAVINQGTGAFGEDVSPGDLPQ